MIGIWSWVELRLVARNISVMNHNTSFQAQRKRRILQPYTILQPFGFIYLNWDTYHSWCLVSLTFKLSESPPLPYDTVEDAFVANCYNPGNMWRLSSNAREERLLQGTTNGRASTSFNKKNDLTLIPLSSKVPMAAFSWTEWFFNNILENIITLS